jgi:hypothetical protein
LKVLAENYSKLSKKSIKFPPSYNPNLDSKNSESNKNVSINPEFYSYYPISGSLGGEEAVIYNLPSSCDWMNLSLNWAPSGTPILAVVEDSTTNTEVGSWLSSNGSMSHSLNLDINHRYYIIIYNSTNITISYTGQITVSIK